MCTRTSVHRDATCTRREILHHEHMYTHSTPRAHEHARTRTPRNITVRRQAHTDTLTHGSTKHANQRLQPRESASARQSSRRHTPIMRGNRDWESTRTCRHSVASANCRMSQKPKAPVTRLPSVAVSTLPPSLILLAMMSEPASPNPMLSSTPICFRVSSSIRVSYEAWTAINTASQRGDDNQGCQLQLHEQHTHTLA